MLDVATAGADPVGGPPDFESEDTRESYTSEVADGSHVAALGLIGVEADKTAGEGIGGDERRGSGRDI